MTIGFVIGPYADLREEMYAMHLELDTLTGNLRTSCDVQRWTELRIAARNLRARLADLPEGPV